MRNGGALAVAVFMALGEGRVFAVDNPLPYSDEVNGRIKASCAHDKRLCADYQELKDWLDSYLSAKPGSPPANVEDLSRQIRKDQGIRDRTRDICHRRNLGASCIDIFDDARTYLMQGLAFLSEAEVAQELRAADQGLSLQEKELNQLDAEVRAAGTDASPQKLANFAAKVRSINEEGTKAWEGFSRTSQFVGDIESLKIFKFSTSTVGAGIRRSALDEDDRIYPLYVTEIGVEIRREANRYSARISALSEKLQALDKKLSAAALTKAQDKINALSDPFADSQDAAPAAAVRPTADGLKWNLLNMPRIRAAPPALLDPPPPAGKAAGDAPKRQSLLPLYSGGKEDSNSDQTLWIQKARDMRLTVTYGQPEVRAKYVFKQGWWRLPFLLRADGTCAIAAQVEMLEAAGVIPADARSQKAWEKKLYERAVKAGYFDDGTSHERLGALLDIPVIEHYPAADEDLFRVIKELKMVIVSVDDGILWNRPGRVGGAHAIVVTGAEAGMTGELLGYYINDTGTNEGGRFVTAKQFLDAWHAMGSIFIEPN